MSDIDDLNQLFSVMEDIVAQQDTRTPAEIYAVSSEHWQLISSTYIENWPKELHALSIPSFGFGLTNEMARILGSYNKEYGPGFDISDISPNLHITMECVFGNIGNAIAAHKWGRAFVRLGSRSPKDCWIPNKEGDVARGIVVTGEDAKRRLTADSERLYEDLQTALAMDYNPYIWVRKWIDLEPWQEFRCFMHERRLVGISQYDYHIGRHEEIVQRSNEISSAIEHLFEAFKDACHLDSVVFDVFVVPTEEVGLQARLLEINPWYYGTDPCLFQGLEDVIETGGFRYCTEMKPKTQYPDPDELLAELADGDLQKE